MSVPLTLTLCSVYRSMCVDALVAEADQDYDWRLNKTEFEGCLSPDFLPGTKSKSRLYI